MKMETMERLEDMCCRELDKMVQRGELTSSSLEQASMLLDAVKDIRTIEAMQEGTYSQAGGYGNGSYDGGSYAGRRGSYAGGNYSRTGGSYSRGRYSRDAALDDMINRMERMANDSSDPGEAEAYRRAMQQLRNA